MDMGEANFEVAELGDLALNIVRHQMDSAPSFRKGKGLLKPRVALRPLRGHFRGRAILVR